jgi:hypothetical protein
MGEIIKEKTHADNTTIAHGSKKEVLVLDRRKSDERVKALDIRELTCLSCG